MEDPLKPGVGEVRLSGSEERLLQQGENSSLQTQYGPSLEAFP
jgi:hypothetical protein